MVPVVPFSSPDDEPTAALVHRHGAFVRSLARRLCRDEAEADDLVQETWLATHRRDAPLGASSRSWLARVMGRIAAKRGQSARARAARERRVAEDAARAAESDDAAAHAHMLRDVAEALLALDDDQRRLVIARHYQGLELRALAEREGVATSTLKLHLGAAYERLRVQLDERALRPSDGAQSTQPRARWQRALALATGLEAPQATPAPVPRAPITAPPAALTPVAPFSLAAILTMGLATNTAVVLLVGSAVVAGIALRGGGAEGQALEPDFPLDAPAAELPAPGLHSAPGERTEVVRAPAAAVVPVDAPSADTLASATFELNVTDLYGAPVSGVELLAAPPDMPLNSIGRTDTNGRLVLRTALGADETQLVYSLRVDGSVVGGLRTAPLVAGGTWKQEVRLGPSFIQKGNVIHFGTLDGGQVFNLYSTVSRGSSGAIESASLARSGGLRVTLSDSTGFVRELAADTRPRRDGILQPAPGPPVDGNVLFTVAGAPRPTRLGLAIDSLRLDSLRLSSEIVSLEGLIPRSGFRADDGGASVTGVVRDLDGSPTADVRVFVRYGGEEEVAIVEARADAEGRYKANVLPGKVEVAVGAGRTPGSSGSLIVDSGNTAELDLTLDRGLVLPGRLVDSDGTTLGEWLVEAHATVPGGEWSAFEKTDAEGLFMVPHCPTNLVSLEFFEGQGRLAVVTHRELAVLAGGDRFEAVVPHRQRVGTRIAIADDRVDAVPAGELRVFDVEGRRGDRLPLTSPVGSELVFDLPVGSWQLQLAATGPHFGAQRTIEVFAPQPAPPSAAESTLAPLPLDLGAFDVGPTGWLDVPAPPEASTWMLERVTPGRARALVRAFGESVERYPLPPGTYRATLRDHQWTLLAEHEVEVENNRRGSIPSAGLPR